MVVLHVLISFHKKNHYIENILTNFVERFLPVITLILFMIGFLVILSQFFGLNFYYRPNVVDHGRDGQLSLNQLIFPVN